jgi:outer membrane receptor protein involved in Fe transport
LAGDDLDWSEDRTGSALLSEWTNRYLWGQWGAAFRPGLRAKTLVAMGEFRRDRGGQMWRARGGDYSPMMGWVSDKGDFSFRQLRQEWQLDLRESLLLKFGYDLRDSDGAYDYHGRATFPEIPPEGGIVQALDSTVVDLGVQGRSVGGWGALRGRLGTAFTGEVGLRFDHQSHTGDSDFAPRLSLRWDPRPDVTFKGSWGRYFQSQRVYELRVGDGEVDFSPSEYAEQVALGIEGRTAEGLSWRVEGYTRTLRSPHPEFVSLARRVVPFPELQTDRVRVQPSRGRGRGIEVILSKEGSGPLFWSGSYALAQAESRVQGEWIPRTLDQRHTLNVHVAYRFNRWRLSGAYQFHTGWPVTEQEAEPELVGGDSSPWEHLVRREFGPLNAVRLPDYARVDLRISRFFELGRSRLEIFLDIFNLTNEGNIRGYEYFLDYPWPYPSSTLRGPGEELLPILPTLGFRWVF